ncbi:hypothetical protein A8L34_01480 [Bacillus sp. FJAT-27264]|uniref:DUF3908 family protein n=1 Tax=Paenibacillus sp. (strain DSM 101736 / FJAT-27264) TaxID=1850362 RepID=UPI000807E05E|nr:DUF3908 family protein [Bacillus sp. FJAT-27264]OBZ18284.1 hypothetical protein A8L34_01480 [Bacillus sp. FJAT-27264]
MKYDQLKSYFGRFGIGNLHYFFQHVDSYLSLEEIDLTYPKDFLKQNSKTFELFVFSKKTIWRFKQQNGLLETSVIKDFKIDNLKIIQSLRDRNTYNKLNITFSFGEKIFLDANEDSNEEWRYEYSGYIKEIFELYK